MIVLMMSLMLIAACFLIVLVLVQRGRGGGLAGALGGMGGQSAFGTKAGDLFTRITIVVATVWILLGVVTIKLLNRGDDPTASGAFGSNASDSETPGKSSGKSGANSEKRGANSEKKGETGGAGTKSSGAAPKSGGGASKKPVSKSTPSSKSE